MSNRRENAGPIVTRAYKEAPDSCARAVALLLKAKGKALGVASTKGDDAKKGSLKHEVRATAIIPDE